MNAEVVSRRRFRVVSLAVLIAAVHLGVSGCGVVLDAEKKVLTAEHFNRAVDAQLAHKDSVARKELRRVLVIDPDHPEANLMMAQYYIKDNDWEKANACLKKATPRNNSDAIGYYLQLADLYDKTGKLDVAENCYRKAYRIRPRNATVQNNLGYFLANHNRKLDEALQLIQKAVRAEPKVAAFTDSLGWVYYRLGKLEEAERELTRAHKLAASSTEESKSPEIHYHLGLVFRDLKRKEDARTEFKHAYDLDHGYQPAKDELSKLGEKIEPSVR